MIAKVTEGARPPQPRQTTERREGGRPVENANLPPEILEKITELREAVAAAVPEGPGRARATKLAVNKFLEDSGYAAEPTQAVGAGRRKPAQPVHGAHGEEHDATGAAPTTPAGRGPQPRVTTTR